QGRPPGWGSNTIPPVRLAPWLLVTSGSVVARCRGRKILLEELRNEVGGDDVMPPQLFHARQPVRNPLPGKGAGRREAEGVDPGEKGPRDEWSRRNLRRNQDFRNSPPETGTGQLDL